VPDGAATLLIQHAHLRLEDARRVMDQMFAIVVHNLPGGVVKIFFDGIMVALVPEADDQCRLQRLYLCRTSSLSSALAYAQRNLSDRLLGKDDFLPKIFVGEVVGDASTERKVESNFLEDAAGYSVQEIDGLIKSALSRSHRYIDSFSQLRRLITDAEALISKKTCVMLRPNCVDI
jgi:hypothetical protein